MIHALFIDPNRCIGCRACEQACSECPGHGGHTMIHLDYLARAASVQTAPTVCMHCADPACASVCPTDAIKVDPAGVVLSAMPERCIGCGNCTLACPFGVPTVHTSLDLMMKCDLCYDRTAAGQKPMCATVCPSGALFYGTRAEVEDLRRAQPLDRFAFGAETVRTRNHLMVPAPTDVLPVARGAGAAVARRTALGGMPVVRPNDAFPIAEATERRLDRRRFLCAAGAATVAVLGGEWLAKCSPDAAIAEPIVLPDLARLALGEALAFDVPGGAQALAVRLDAATIVAFDRRCPHLGCPVVWAASRMRFECPCHRAVFAARTGQVVAGPPRRGLTPVPLEIA